MSISFNAGRTDFTNRDTQTGQSQNLFTKAVELAKDGSLSTTDLAELKKIAASDQHLTLNEADFIAELEKNGADFSAEVSAKSQDAEFDPKAFQWSRPSDTKAATVPARVTALKAGKEIAKKYDPGASSLPKDGSLQIGALKTREDRLQALGNISQISAQNLDPAAERSESENSRCGAACLVAGALYAEGNPGLGKLTHALRQFDQKHKLQMDLDPDLKALEERIEKGTATQADISKLQDLIYQSLNRLEGEIQGDSDPLLANPTIGAFIHESPELKELFDSNGLEIHNIDNDGDGKVNHLTLSLGNGSYYEPMYKGDGNQIVQTPEESALYAATKKTSAYPFLLSGLKSGTGAPLPPLKAEKMQIDEDGNYVIATRAQGQAISLTMERSGAIVNQSP
jgi:hypothetical protein